MINDKQAQSYRKLLCTGKHTRDIAAIKAGMTAKNSEKVGDWTNAIRKYKQTGSPKLANAGRQVLWLLGIRRPA